MLMEQYRGKTRILILHGHPLAFSTREEWNESVIKQWLNFNCKGHWSCRFTAKLKDDVRDFTSILFADEDDAHLFRLTHVKPGDITTSKVAYTRIDRNSSSEEIDESELAETDYARDALTFAGQIESRGYKTERGIWHCYSIKRNLAGYFLCWQQRGRSITKVSPSKTKRIVIERVKRRAGIVI